LDQDWLDALSEYDDAADQDVIDGAAWVIFLQVRT